MGSMDNISVLVLFWPQGLVQLSTSPVSSPMVRQYGNVMGSFGMSPSPASMEL
jgi:hypothetical protein